MEAESPTVERNGSSFFAGEQSGMKSAASIGEIARDSTDSGNSSPTLTVPTMRRVRVSRGWMSHLVVLGESVFGAENLTQIGGCSSVYNLKQCWWLPDRLHVQRVLVCVGVCTAVIMPLHKIIIIARPSIESNSASCIMKNASSSPTVYIRFTEKTKNRSHTFPWKPEVRVMVHTILCTLNCDVCCLQAV